MVLVHHCAVSVNAYCRWGPPLTWCSLFGITKKGAWHAGAAEVVASRHFNVLHEVLPRIKSARD